MAFILVRKRKTIIKQLYNIMLGGECQEENDVKEEIDGKMLSEEVVLEQPLE